MILLRCDGLDCVNQAETVVDRMQRLVAPVGWWIVPGNPGCVACSPKCAAHVRKPNNDK